MWEIVIPLDDEEVQELHQSICDINLIRGVFKQPPVLGGVCNRLRVAMYKGRPKSSPIEDLREEGRADERGRILKYYRSSLHIEVQRVLDSIERGEHGARDAGTAISAEKDGAAPFKEFPIFLTYEQCRTYAGPLTVPWSALAAHEDQARKNHGGQSLETLASRGGLGPDEACAVLEDRRWRAMPLAEAGARLRELLNKERP
jgi:hypothetical protein